MKIKTKEFQVRADKKIKLNKCPTKVDPYYKSKEDYQEILQADTDKLIALQNLLYASNSYSLLLILQGMDSAGKDGIVKHVMSGVNPEGCEVNSFKHPSAEELDHDFLWRYVSRLPTRGAIGIFNRSYYEEVLIVRVHPEILRCQGLPKELVNEKKIWQNRYSSIINLENHLHNNGTQIIKFFLHLSKEEQRQRFLQRIDEPEKNWKLSNSDITERKCWDKYTAAYEQCLNATSSNIAPWYITPADDKENARLIVSRVIIETLNKLNLAYPKPNKKRLAELESIRKSLKRQR